MEVVLLIGIPASGKSTFYKERFVDTHVRINRDMLRTRFREERLFQFCLESQQCCVFDNTNVIKEVRARFIALAVEAGFSKTELISMRFPISRKGVLASFGRNMKSKGRTRKREKRWRREGDVSRQNWICR